jgi:AcrR family transcriptional regulator
VSADGGFPIDGPDSDGWQARKSAQMRAGILDAAITCLADYGFARLTTQMIAERAGVSRGAMLHHYATKMDLVAGVIDHVFHRRMQRFAADIASLTEHERVDELRGLELLWLSLQGEVFAAQLELAIAARTDSDVQALYEPKAVHFNQLWRKQITALFPEGAAQKDRELLAIDVAQAMLEGLQLNRAIYTEKSRRVAVRAVLAQVVTAIRAGEIAG